MQLYVGSEKRAAPPQNEERKGETLRGSVCVLPLWGFRRVFVALPKKIPYRNLLPQFSFHLPEESPLRSTPLRLHALFGR